MNVNTFLDEVGDVLGEDFTYGVVWTKAELLGYLRKIVQDFASRTRIADKCEIKVASGTTGETAVPNDFGDGYYIQWDGRQCDIVKVGELDFVLGTWALGTTGTTPKACSIFGAGKNGAIRFVPVPSSVMGAYLGTTITSVHLTSPDLTQWQVQVTNGQIVTSADAGAPDTVVLASPSYYWDLAINDSGELVTTVSASTTESSVYVVDTTTGKNMRLFCTDDGEVATTMAEGLAAKALLNQVQQTFSQELGIIIDMYATGVVSTPEAVGRLNSPRGLTLYERTSDDSAMVWYKGEIDDVPNTTSELFISPAFLPIIKHGVLMEAFMHDGPGRDIQKAQALKEIYELECELTKRLFQRK